MQVILQGVKYFNYQNSQQLIKLNASEGYANYPF